MIGFEYNTPAFNEMFNNLKLIQDYSISEIIMLLLGIILIITFTLKVIPALKIYVKYVSDSKEKDKRKKLLKKITLQKDFEDKISKDLNISN